MHVYFLHLYIVFILYTLQHCMYIVKLRIDSDPRIQ